MKAWVHVGFEVFLILFVCMVPLMPAIITISGLTSNLESNFFLLLVDYICLFGLDGLVGVSIMCISNSIILCGEIRHGD